MTTVNLLWFAAAVGVTLFLLLWRMIRAEDGYGFMPISQDMTYALIGAILEASAMACFVFAFILILTA